jgi:F-type H+-transporting ATPase subunit delta
MNPSLQGYASAVLNGLTEQESAVVAADLISLERLVATQPELFAAFTDTALAPSVRRAVATDLLGAKVAPATLSLVLQAITVVPAQEVGVAITWLQYRSLHTAEGREWFEEPLSAISARRRVQGFAASVFASLSNDDLAVVGDELYQLARLVAKTLSLRSVLGDRDLQPSVRATFLENLLVGKVHPATSAIACYLPYGGRARDVVGALDAVVVKAAETRGWRVARVLAGADLDAAQRDALSASLEALAGNPVDVYVSLDESLMAGVVVEIGDLRLDDSLRGRLDVLREHVAASKQQFVSQLTTTNEGAS